MNRAMPTNEKNSKEETIDYNYCFTVFGLFNESSSSQGHRTDALVSASTDIEDKSKCCYYCYVSYKQVVSTSTSRDTFSNNSVRSSTPLQRSLVIISKYPIPNLAYNVLATIESTLFHVLHPDPKSPKSGTAQDISKAFDVSLEQIHSNWAPLILSRGDSEEMSTGGHGLSWHAGIALPFFGDV